MTVIEAETIRLFLKNVTKERSSRDQISRYAARRRLAGPEVEAGRGLGLRLQRGRHRVHERHEVEEREADHQHVDHDSPSALAERARRDPRRRPDHRPTLERELLDGGDGRSDDVFAVGHQYPISALPKRRRCARVIVKMIRKRTAPTVAP